MVREGHRGELTVVVCVVFVGVVGLMCLAALRVCWLGFDSLTNDVGAGGEAIWTFIQCRSGWEDKTRIFRISFTVTWLLRQKDHLRYVELIVSRTLLIYKPTIALDQPRTLVSTPNIS